MTMNLVAASVLMLAAVLASAQTASRPKDERFPNSAQLMESPIGENSTVALLQRGLYFSDLYNWPAARPYLIRSRRLFETNGDKRNALYAELAVIRAGAETGSLSELSYGISHELTTNALLRSDKELRMFALVVKGELDGEVDSAAMRQDWTEVSRLAGELGNDKWRFRAQGQLGFADFYDGDVPGAQRNVAAALIGATTVHDIGGEIFYLSATAEGLVGQNLNDEALQYADRAIALARTTADAGYPIIAEKARLIAIVNKGQIEAAKTELHSVLGHAEAHKSYGQMADLNETAARIARLQDNLPEAIRDLTEALRDATIVDTRKVIPELQSELSDVYRLSGNLSKAEEVADQAATSVQKFGYVPMLPAFLQVLAEIQTDEHKFVDADRTYDRAAAIQDVMIGNTNSPLGKTALVKGAGDLYAKHFALLADHTGNVPKAFTVLERARGRVMSDLLLSGGKTSPGSLAVENKIAHLRLKLMAARSNREMEKIRDAIFLTEQSRSITPEINILQTSEHQVISLAALQEDLSPAEAMLEYVIDDPTSYCLIITRTRHRVVRLSSKRAISAAADAYLREVKAKRPAMSEARKLYQLLLAPVPETEERQQLVIVRDGPLHLVPFDALINDHEQYVMQSHTVVYAPSAMTFFLLRQSRPQRKTSGMLAVGGVPYGHSGLKASAVTRGFGESGLEDLPGSADEARAAMEALPSDQNILLVGTGATETAVKNSMNRRVIHLAVHAIANSGRPDRASLVLLSDPTNGEDGFLEASEIVQLRLSADLVVLSACNTAVGPIEGEEGISTLARAFLLAGARTVISTLWSINDNSTVYLMKVFYSRLSRGEPAPYALRMAKQDMLETFGSTSALPYYWAGFTLEGLARAPVEH